MLLFFPREMTNCRMEAVAADMPLCRRRRRTWLCSGGEGAESSVAHSSVITLHSRWTVWTQFSFSIKLYIFLFLRTLNALFDLSLIPALLSVRLQTCYEWAAGNRESLRRGAALRVAGVCSPHMEESQSAFHACLPFHVFVFVCFRDTPPRWIIQQCLTSSLLLCRTKRRFCLATCQKFTTSTRGEWVPSGCHW